MELRENQRNLNTLLGENQGATQPAVLDNHPNPRRRDGIPPETRPLLDQPPAPARIAMQPINNNRDEQQINASHPFFKITIRGRTILALSSSDLLKLIRRIPDVYYILISIFGPTEVNIRLVSCFFSALGAVTSQTYSTHRVAMTVMHVGEFQRLWFMMGSHRRCWRGLRLLAEVTGQQWFVRLDRAFWQYMESMDPPWAVHWDFLPGTEPLMN